MTAPLASLDELIAELATPPIRIGWRTIGNGDAGALLPEEATHFARAVPAVRNRSGAARLLARRLLADFGREPAPIGRHGNGAPLWPHGICGSLAHDDKLALAAIARCADVASLGIDIEPDMPLPPDIISLVATPAERARYAPAVIASRLLFVAKEAAYKAAWPLDGIFLDFADIDIELERGIASTTSGRVIPLTIARGSHILALAHTPA